MESNEGSSVGTLLCDELGDKGADKEAGMVTFTS
jgi:hypothetical protein